MGGEPWGIYGEDSWEGCIESNEFKEIVNISQAAQDTMLWTKQILVDHHCVMKVNWQLGHVYIAFGAVEEYLSSGHE